MKKLFILILIMWWGGFIFLFQVFAQNEVLENLELDKPSVYETVQNEGQFYKEEDSISLSAQAENFQTVKEIFLQNQTLANKEIYDQTAVWWAQELLAAQISLIDKTQHDLQWLFDQNKEIPTDWLTRERENLENLADKLDQAKNYNQARVIINQAADIWEQTGRRIQQLRAWSVYQEYFNLLEQAQEIHDRLQIEQQVILKNMVAEEAVVWDEWNLVFTTYADQLAEVKSAVREITGEFIDLVNWTSLDENDQIWQSRLLELQKLLLALESLQILQKQALLGYYQITDRLVFPKNMKF